MIDEAPRLITSREELARLAEELAATERIAVDVEGNGLHAHRTRLCTVQLAWEVAEQRRTAVVDTLAVDPRPLAAVLGPRGPLKLLHDLGFDARMLAEAGAPLGNVHDTAIFARFLGHPATGLARVLEEVLSVSIRKDLQKHDWSRRPFGQVELDYLASDVAHLLPLHQALLARATERDILEEIGEECRHRLLASTLAADDPRPAWARIKGAAKLDARGRAVLRRLVALREELAERADLPAGRIVANATLVELARRAPRDRRELAAIAGSTAPERFLEAIARGEEDGDVPEDERSFVAEAAPSPAELTRRRRAEAALGAWRRREAERREVDEQVVLPGHCLDDLAALLVDGATGAALEQRLATIAGLGARRLARYGEAWVRLADELAR